MRAHGAAIGALLAGIPAVYFLSLPFHVAAGASVLVAWLVHRTAHEAARRRQDSGPEQSQ